jgi:hypothetical protein
MWQFQLEALDFTTCQRLYAVGRVRSIYTLTYFPGSAFGAVFPVGLGEILNHAAVQA